MSPDYKGLLCVPIAPHTIQARAFMTSPSDVVEVKMSTSRPSVPAIAVDGQFLNPEGEVDRVEVSRAPYDAMLLDYGPESFYSSVSRVFYGVRRHDLDELHVENLALISEATLVPDPGLTVLTGETGAGKTRAPFRPQALMGSAPTPRPCGRGRTACPWRRACSLPPRIQRASASFAPSRPMAGAA